MITVAELIWKGTNPSYLPIFKKMGSASYCIRTMTQNTLPVQSRNLLRIKKWKVLDRPSQSTDLNLIEHEFHQLKRRVKAETHQKHATIGIGCIQGWEKYFKGWDQESGDVYGSQTHCCDCVQGICNCLDSTANRAIVSLLFQYLWRPLYLYSPLW